ncbi:MAG: sugar kinase [Deltaproteobacteria bacterium]|nr:sugar kinase [Deltaproteobacteria bacterium]MBW1909576.1 sugar kinase [Deltaproteobacteria bacterium]
MSNKLQKIHVVGLGQSCVDYLGTTTLYPPEDGKIELTDLDMRCGGPASTALVTLSRLGISTSFLGSISDDLFGKKIIENLKNEKVDVSYLKVTPGYTSQFAFIAVTQRSGKRTILWHRGSVPHLTPGDVDLSFFQKARVLHVDSLMIEASIEAARQAKELGMYVVMDAGTMRQGSKELAQLVDIIIASESFASPLVGLEAPVKNALHVLRDLGPKQVVITLGAKGSIGLNDQGTFRQEAFQVKTVDTTGAGDVYHGAYIYGLLQGWEMPKCMRFASAAAALKCEKIGAQTGIPDLGAIKSFTKEDAR